MIKNVKQKVTSKLKNDPKRLKHVLGVYETALKLAEIYDADLEMVGIASLYHDYAKNESLEDYKKILSPSELETYKAYPVMYHALSSAKHLEKDFKISNKEILNAVKSHIWGRPNMSLVEKIVFVADYCEPNRTFIDTNSIYDLATRDLDLAVLVCMKSTIAFLKQVGATPSLEQIEAYQYYMEVNSGKTK